MSVEILSVQPRWVSNALLVGVGGFVGSALRYALAGYVHTFFRAESFPYGTLVVNIVGCLAIGLLAGAADTRQILGPETRLLLLIGLLGGFTTFSTFGYETLTLARDADYWLAAVNVLGHVLLGLLAVWVGLIITKAW